MVDGSLREDAVPEVEDMPGSSLGLVQDPPGLALDLRNRCQQYGRIEVPLDTHALTEPLPGAVELNAPIEADDRTTRVSLELQQRGSVGPKVNHGNARLELLEESGHVRLYEAPIIRRA